eukprot:384502-Lingulodinium_polyedra.AAC.1
MENICPQVIIVISPYVARHWPAVCSCSIVLSGGQTSSSASVRWLMKGCRAKLQHVGTNHARGPCSRSMESARWSSGDR